MEGNVSVFKIKIKGNSDKFWLKLPYDTFNVLGGEQNFLKKYYKEIENFNLLLNRFKIADTNEIAFWLRFAKYDFFEQERNETLKLKSKFLQYQKVEKAIKEYYNLIEKQENTIELTTTWRLIVGLGNESTSETSLTLHHIYGIPYIPGSAVKGVVRSFILQEVFDNDEEKALKGNTDLSKKFIEIFGTQEQEGKVIFFDAFPSEEPSIEPDVMNVHYPDYYSGNKPPTDYQNPTPIYFLAVKGKFKFVLAARKGKLDDYKIEPLSDYKAAEGNQQEKGTIMWWLYEALTNHGIGAKTAVGYGRFKVE